MGDRGARQGRQILKRFVRLVRSRRRLVRRGLLLGAICLFVVLSGRGGGPGRDVAAGLAAARTVGFPAYYLGDRFRGLELEYVEVRSRDFPPAVLFGYGTPTCRGHRWLPLLSRECDYPVVIKTERYDARFSAFYVSSGGSADRCKRTQVRGVPVARSAFEVFSKSTSTGATPMVFTGPVSIDVQTDPARVRAAVMALRRVGEARGGDRLPPPPTRGKWNGCDSDARVIRPEPVLLALERARATHPDALFLGATYRGRWLNTVWQTDGAVGFRYVSCGSAGCSVSLVDNSVPDLERDFKGADGCKARRADAATVLAIHFPGDGDSTWPFTMSVLLSGPYDVTLQGADRDDLQRLEGGSRDLPAAVSERIQEWIEHCAYIEKVYG